MSLQLTFVGPPLPSTKRGYGARIDVHKDGDTVAYGNSKFVITRSLTPGGPAKVYTEHKCAVSVARFSPSGMYVASADEMGHVRVWSYTHAENLLKKESKQLASIAELTWDGEGKRISVSGNGKKKGSCFSWDSGASLDKGLISGLASNCPGLAFTPKRPFRLVIGDEDGRMGFFKGPPFAMIKVADIHKNVIQCIRYCKDGSRFVTCSSDKKIRVFDGKTAEPIATMKSGKKSRHAATVYGVAWNEDSTKLFTASSDKTCKLWDVESNKLVAKFSSSGTDKPQLRNQQLACAYSKHGPISVALSGDLTIYDVDKADAPIKAVIVGHQAPLSALAYDPESDTLATGCRGGVICIWKDGVARRFSGDADSSNSTIVHKAGVTGLSMTKAAIHSVGIDGVRNTLDVASGKPTSSEGTGSACVCISSARSKPGTFVIGNKGKKLTLVVGGKTAGTADLTDEPLCVAISDDGADIIACTDDACVHFFSACDLKLKETINIRRKVYAAAFSPDKATYALGVSGTYTVSLYKTADYSTIISSAWTHSATIDTLAFSPDGKYLASGAKDGNISLWMPSDKTFNLVTRAHFQGVSSLVFTKDGLASIGADNCLKTWKLGAADAPAAAAAASY